MKQKDASRNQICRLEAVDYSHPNLPAIVRTETSDIAVGGALSQKHEMRRYTGAFHLRRSASAGLYYDSFDKDVLAMVDTFKIAEVGSFFF